MQIKVSTGTKSYLMEGNEKTKDNICHFSELVNPPPEIASLLKEKKHHQVLIRYSIPWARTFFKAYLTAFLKIAFYC